MKKQPTPKLTLSRETLRALESQAALLAVAGGDLMAIDTTWPSCPSKCETC